MTPNKSDLVSERWKPGAFAIVLRIMSVRFQDRVIILNKVSVKFMDLLD